MINNIFHKEISYNLYLIESFQRLYLNFRDTHLLIQFIFFQGQLQEIDYLK